MDEIVEDVIDGLTSTTAKDRKGEARKLLQHIDTEPLHLYLDRRAVSPGKSIRYASNEEDPSAPWISWPGLIRAVITCSDSEVVKSKKGPDANLIKLFRAVAASATRPNRPPSAATRVGGRMFAHTVSRLTDFGLSSEVGDAYSRALSSMLNSPHLPPLCSAPDFAELVGMLCREVNVLLATVATDGQISTQLGGASRSVSTTSEITKALQRLEAVLRAVPATLPATRTQLLLEFFTELFPAIAGMHGQHALAHAAVTALSSLFLQHGVQAYASVHTVWQQGAPFVRLLWSEAQSGVESQLAVQARLACSHAALLALRLDAVRRRRLFQELWGLLCAEVRLVRHAPPPPGGSLVHAHAPPGPLSHTQALVVRLAAMHLLRHHRRYSRSPASAPPPAGDAGAGDVPRTEAPVLKAFCVNMRQPDAQQATWLAAAAYFVWELPHALEVAEVAQIVTSACDAVAAAIKIPHGEAGAEPAGGDTAPWGAAAWGLLVLEGAARVAWGVPLFNRAADGPQLCTDAGLGTTLWPQALATALPRARMVALSEAAVAAAGGANSPHAHAASCRALWLRAALLQRHLEPGLPENGSFWGLVDSLMSGTAAQWLRGGSDDLGSQAPRQPRGTVRLHGTAHASQKAPCTRDASACDLELQRAALEASAHRLHVLHSLHACPPAALQRLVTAAVAAPLPALPRVHALVRGLGLPVPQPFLPHALLQSSRVSPRDCLAMADPKQPYMMRPGCSDRGGLQGFMQDVQAVEGQPSGGHCGTMTAWGCTHESIQTLDCLVPDSCAPGPRAAKDVWAALQDGAEPLSHMPALHYIVRRHAGELVALSDALTAQLRQHSAPPTTHAAMLSQLEALAVAAACMLAAAQGATFDGAGECGPAVAEMFEPDGRLCRALCATVRAVLCDSRDSDAGLFAALSALLTDPGQLEPPPVVMASQMFPPGGSAAGGGARGGSMLATQATANHRPPGAAARLQERQVPQFSSHAAAVDVLPEGCEDAEPFLSMHVVQTLQVLMCALGGLRQLRLLPDEIKRACANACQACVKVLEGVYEASDKLANEKAPEKPNDDFLAPRPPKAARRSAPAATLGASLLSAAHARCLAVLSAAAHADPCAALGALQHAFEWLDDREERGAAPGGVGFVPQVEWIVGLGSAAAVCGDCGAGAAAWRLVTDLVYHDSFGLMKWSPGSLQACHALLTLQTAMARWAALQPASVLMPPPGARGHDEVGILQELSDLLPLVLRRCKAVATELCGRDAAEAAELRIAAPPQLRCHWLATLAQVARNVACAPCITEELREVALSCLADPCVRVRLCAAAVLPSIFAHGRAEAVLPAVALYVHLPGYADTLRRRKRAAAGLLRPDGAPENLLEAILEAEAPAACMATERRECAMAAYVALSHSSCRAGGGGAGEEALVATLTGAGACSDDTSLNSPEKIRAYFAPIRALLNWGACREGYPSWPHMLRVRAAPLLATWAAVGCTVTDLTLVSTLLWLPSSSGDSAALAGEGEAGTGVFGGPFGGPAAHGDGAETRVHADAEVFYPSSHYVNPDSHRGGPIMDTRVVAPVVSLTIEEIAGGQDSVYDDIWHAQQALGPILGAVVAAYAALMHSHRPLRFNPPTDDGADGPPPHALPLPALAKRAFRFAREELAHLARVFGFRGPEELRAAVAPALLAATAPAEAARATHGVHALDGPVATEAASITKEVDTGVAEEVLHCAPCAVACQLLLHTAPPNHWPAPDSSVGDAVGDVAEAAARAWARRREDATAAQEARHEGMLACAGRGWPWFAVGRAATQVLSGARGRGSERIGRGAGAGGNEAAVAAEQAVHLAQVGDRHVSQLAGPTDLRHGVAAAAALLAAIAPASELWRAAAPATKSRKGGKSGAAGPALATPALAATFRTILRLLHACVHCYRPAALGRYNMLDEAHQALVAAVALLYTALQTVGCASHCPLLISLLPPLAAALQAATHHLQHSLAALPCGAPWPDARQPGETPMRTLRRFLVELSDLDDLLPSAREGGGAPEMVTLGHLFERSSAGAAQAAAAAVELADACVALAYDACDRCVKLRDGAGEGMDVMDMRRVALVAGMGQLPQALGQQAHHRHIMTKLLDHSGISNAQQQELLTTALAKFAAWGHRTQHGCHVLAVASLTALADSCATTACTAQPAADSTLPPAGFSPAATLLARMPAMHAATDSRHADAAAGDSAVATGGHRAPYAGAWATDTAKASPLDDADAAAAAAEGQAARRLDTDLGALLATLLKSVPEHVSDAHVAVHTAEVAAFGALPHVAPSTAPLWRGLLARRVAPTTEGPTPSVGEEHACMVGTVLADLATTSAAVDPAAVSSAHAHAAAAALLRMLRHTEVRQAARAVLKAAEEDAQAVHSVQLTVLSGLLGAFSGTTDDSPPNLPEPSDAEPVPLAALNPQSAPAWSLCVAGWLLQHPCLFLTPLRHLHVTAGHSPRLCAALLPLALATAASRPENSEHSSATSPARCNAHASYLHLHSEFSDLLSNHLLPSPTESSSILQNAPHIVQASSQAPAGASMHFSATHADVAPSHTCAELTAAPLGVLRLALACLGALRVCYGSARVHRLARGQAVRAQVAWVCGWESEAWLRIDPLQVAAACLAAGSPQEALQYLELWAAAHTRSSQFPTAVEAAAAADSGGCAVPAVTSAGLALRQEEALLWATLRMLRDPDAAHGLASVPKEPVLLAMADLQGQWPQALQLHAHRLHTAAAACGPGACAAAAAAAGVRRCLTHMGCGSLLQDLQSPMYRTHAFPGSSAAAGFLTPACLSKQQTARAGLTTAAAAASTVGAWDVPQVSANGRSEASSDVMHDALAAVAAGALPAALEATLHGQAAVIAAAGSGGLADVMELHGVQVKLQAAEAAIATIRGLQRLPAGSAAAAQAEVVTEVWNPLLSSDFIRRHPRHGSDVHGLSTALLRAVGAPLPALTTATAAQAAALRKAGRLPAALHHHLELHALLGAAAGTEAAGDVCGEPEVLAAAVAAWRLEEAKLLWTSGRQQLAVKLAEDLQGDLDDVPDDGAERAGAAVALAAKWSMQLRGKPTAAVLEGLQAAVGLVQRSPAVQPPPQSGARTLTGRVHFRLAHFADRQHRATVQALASVDHQNRRSLLEAKRRRSVEVKATWTDLQQRGAIKQLKDRHGGRIFEDPAHDQLHAAYNHISKSLPVLEAEMQEAEDRPLQFLQVALQAYSDALAHSSSYDMRAVLRLVQLWLENADTAGTTAELEAVFRKILDAVPSHKLLYLAYQMASRLTMQGTPFQALLWDVVARLAADHPHHVLLHLLCLETHSSDTKKGAAQQVLQEARGRSAELPRLLSELRTVVGGYVAIATQVPTQEHRKGATFAQMGLARSVDAVTGKTSVPVLSLPVAPRPDAVYEGLPYVAKVLPNIKFVGGVHAPKCIDVVDSHGQKHRQLVKSNDDLRQDAVMQQFFALVNHLLAADAASATRRLRMATYHAVAFSGDSGLVQWVTNTLCLNEYLVGSNAASGAHARYGQPGDMTHNEAQVVMVKAHREPGKQGVRAAYDRVAARYPPVLRHFFSERYCSPMLWLEKRRAYGRSVAVSSVAGYIIGLGDRHGSNVLLDAAAAEVLHIDLGIAFEAGRLLPTPEMSPFRMTRDVVDGLGVEGVNGTLRACAEHTLRVLRAAHEAVVTIVEVFVHDPLQAWAATPASLSKRQRGSGSSAAAGDSAEPALSPDAGHAVARVSAKLRGLDWGEPEQLSIEGHVAQLLLEATDPGRLCMHYPGWAPWL